MGRFVLKEFRDNKMYLIKKDKGISQLLRKGQKAYDKRELAFMSILRDNINEGDICMDIGANIGFVALQMARLVGDTGYIYAIEPDPTNIDVLKMNRDINHFQDRMDVDHMAISDSTGTAGFFVSNKSNLGSLSKNSHCSGNTIDVRVETLDSFLVDKELPVFYKMDVEGHEVNVLDGMRDVASRSKSGTKILMEVHPQFYSKDLDMEKSLQRMVSFGFYFKYVISAGVPIPDLFRERGYSPSVIYDNFSRAIYDNISDEDVIYFCSRQHKQYMPSKKKDSLKIVRAIMLEKR